MKTIRHLLLALLLPCSLSAQLPPDFYVHTVESCLFPQEAPWNYLLANEVSLREGPGPDRGFIRSLPIGSRFRVLARDDSLHILNGLRGNWYEIAGDGFKGWIWGGFIARQAWRSQADPDILFLYGLEKAVRPTEGRPRLHYQIRAVREGREINRIRLTSFASDLGNIDTPGPCGIRDLDDIFIASVPCHGGCGCLTGSIVIFWNNRQFYPVFELRGTPDGEFSQGQYLLFPSDAEGTPGFITRISTSYENCPEPCDSLTRRRTREFFRWNGYKLISGEREPEVTTYKQPIG